MSKEFFSFPETNSLFNQQEEISQRVGVSRARVFETFLHVSVCALGHPLMEDEYLQAIEKYKAGPPGKRGVDMLAQMFANLVHIMTETDHDHLGDLFEGSISYGENGLFFTPESICNLMARMTMPLEKKDLEGRRTVADECCGSGRMLLAAARAQPNWHFVGKDIDLRCVRMAAINLLCETAMAISCMVTLYG